MGTTYDASAATWRKSSYSNGNGGACVEVSDDFPGLVPVRDSKAPGVGHLTIPTTSWTALTLALHV
ncbi:DUF397 domain-containing protein [Embleya sp. NPDC005575]|uniref:DUF397 domain-containing protein n=1 Tax=Embleya sp. NPDC005575 TaxID=3156892 RepID=UPI0033B226E0